MPSESLLSVLMRRDGLTRNEALELIREARAAVAAGADPEEILLDEFDLEADYIFDLI